MKTSGSKLSLLCAVLLVCVVSAKAQSEFVTPNSGKNSILTVQSVNRSQVVYDLKVIEPEFPIEQLASHFLEKSGILACTTRGNSLQITTEPELERNTIISIVKAAGFRKTYNTYKLELRAAVPQQEHRQESR